MARYGLKYNGKVHILDTDKETFDGMTLVDQRYRILKKIVEARGMTVSAYYLKDLLWNDETRPTGQLNSIMSHLRKDIEAPGNTCIRTIISKNEVTRFALACELVKPDEILCNVFTSDSTLIESEVDDATEFRFREKDYNEFMSSFDPGAFPANRVAIRSDGGIGKTTFARLLFARLRKNVLRGTSRPKNADALKYLHYGKLGNCTLPAR